MKKTITLHMIMTGEMITKLIQDGVIEHNMLKVDQVLETLIPVPTFEQKMNLVKGNAQFIGATLCDDPKCDQCKGLEPFAYTLKPDIHYQEELAAHRAYIKQRYFEIDGNIVVEKAVITDFFIKYHTLESMKVLRYTGQDVWRKVGDKKLSKKFMEATDELEFAIDNLYHAFNIKRHIDYKIGSPEWKKKLEVESTIDIIKAQSSTSKEIKDIIKEAKKHGKITTKAAYKVYQITCDVEDNPDSKEDHERILDYLSTNKEPKNTAPKSKDMIKLGKFEIPKELLEEYAAKVHSMRLEMHMAKYREGLDPIREMKRLNARVELHKRIYSYLKLPYHADIKERSKLSKLEKDSLKLTELIEKYVEGGMKDGS